MSQLQTPLDDVAGGAALLSASVGPVVVMDPTENHEKTRLIEAGDPFEIKLSWSLTGTLVPFFSGIWVVELFIDDLGEGSKSGSLGKQQVAYPLGSGTPTPPPGPDTTFTEAFETTFTVQTAKADVGVYQLTATVDLSLDNTATGSSEMFGFIESGPIRIQDVKVD